MDISFFYKNIIIFKVLTLMALKKKCVLRPVFSLLHSAQVILYSFTSIQEKSRDPDKIACLL